MPFKDEELKRLAQAIINRAVAQQLPPPPAPEQIPMVEKIRQSLENLMPKR